MVPLGNIWFVRKSLVLWCVGGENTGDAIQMLEPGMQMCALLTCPDGDPSGIVNMFHMPGFLLCMYMPWSHLVHVFIYETQHSNISYVAVTIKNEEF